MRGLVLIVLTIAITGCSDTPTPAPSPTSEPAPAPAVRLMIEPVPEAQTYFHLVDADTLLFKYSGGLIDCWLEETIADQRPGRVIHAGEEILSKLTNAKVNPDEAKAGFVVLTRRTLDDKELWDLKLVVELSGQRQLSVKLTGATTRLQLQEKGVHEIRGFTLIKEPQAVDGETSLFSINSDTPDGKAVVQLKCAAMKVAAR